MMLDGLLDAITWAEVKAEKARENAEYYAAAPMDYDGKCTKMAKFLTQEAERLELLAEAARKSLPKEA